MNVHNSGCLITMPYSQRRQNPVSFYIKLFPVPLFLFGYNEVKENQVFNVARQLITLKLLYFYFSLSNTDLLSISTKGNAAL